MQNETEEHVTGWVVEATIDALLSETIDHLIDIYEEAGKIEPDCGVIADLSATACDRVSWAVKDLGQIRRKL